MKRADAPIGPMFNVAVAGVEALEFCTRPIVKNVPPVTNIAPPMLMSTVGKTQEDRAQAVHVVFPEFSFAT